MTTAPAPAAARGYEERIDPATGVRYLEVSRRGDALKDDPLLNKGTCFTEAERDLFGLRGLIPPAVSTPDEQAARAYENFLRIGDDVARYLFLAALQDRNETLFYRLVIEHFDEMIPIIYTPTVGAVCERYSHIYRRPRGIYVSTGDRGRIAQLLRNAGRDDVRNIVATDNEAILGIGDQGVGGMGIAIGKIALYTAGAGIHPARGLPIDLDVGTDNESLLADPLYLGVRHPRLRGEAYVSFLDELVGALAQVFPGAIVQWEDFANERAFEVLRRYQPLVPSFDDDIQGTGAVVEAGIRTALAGIGRRLDDERIVFFGAGASGAGCALQVRRALGAAGLSATEVSQRVLSIDSRGLILSDRPGLGGHKKELAADPALLAGWSRSGGSGFSLRDVVANFRPTILIGASGQPGAFGEDVIRAMHAGCARPIVLPMSNPTSKMEAVPADILAWTNGAAVVGTGSPCAPVTMAGITHHIGQCNNAFVFPGIGLGASVAGARSLPDAAFAAAARAVSDFTGVPAGVGASIFPPLAKLRDVSRVVAAAVAHALIENGAARPATAAEIDRRLTEAIWEPTYLEYRLTGHT